MSRTVRCFARLACPFSLMLLGILACSDASPTGPSDEFTDLVGDWEAYLLEVAAVADPSVREDILAQGATFRVNFQPSGQYTAVLTFLGASQVEIGTADLDGNQLTLYRAVPSPDTSVAVLTRLDADHIRLEGTTFFDFEGDGTREEAELLAELARQES
ncbi:MAG TPA: hypothetical protein VK858_00135 [Longimicrobiales bacterium]|nr:hypothetical protein [Longimicrobiales bacterium]